VGIGFWLGSLPAVPLSNWDGKAAQKAAVFT